MSDSETVLEDNEYTYDGVYTYDDANISGEEVAENLDALTIGEEINETENQTNEESNETENQIYEELNLPESPTGSDSMNISVKKELDIIVQDFGEREILPNVVAELTLEKNLNYMILDLYDYDKGFDLFFYEFGTDAEIHHGRYSYAVNIIEYIRDGQIPYPLFDELINYKFRLYYDGYVICQLRMHFKEENMRSHFVLLKHTIQTVTGECAMICKADENFDFEMERARLISHYSPDLCLDPSPVVAEIIISNELNQPPFINRYLRHIIEDEKARREKGVQLMDKTSFKDSEFTPTNREGLMNWSFRLSDPTEEEIELAEMASKMELKWSIVPYLKSRQMCFPDKDSYTGFHVEIENFVYEYNGLTRAKKLERISDKLCIGVLDDKEYYYGAYKLDERMKDWVSFYWWDIGCREDLDIYVNAITKLELKLCSGEMKITHNRLFDERVQFSDGKITVVREKLENPVSRAVRDDPLPSPEGQNEETDES